MKRNFLIISVSLLIILSTTFGSGININNDPSLQTKKTQSQNSQPQSMPIELTGEILEIKQKDNLKVLISAPLAKTKTQLLAYKQRTIERLNSLKPNEQIDAVITFNKVVDENIITQQIANESLVKTLNFIAIPEGGGNVDYPITPQERKRLTQLEKMVIQNMQTFCDNIESELAKVTPGEREIARKSFEKQCNSYRNFKIVKGFTSARVNGSKEKLLGLATNSNVFAVDVGPIELLKENPNAKIVVVKDVWQEYNSSYNVN